MELIEIEISHLLKQNHQLTISMDTATTTTQPITPPIIQPIIQPATFLQQMPAIRPVEVPLTPGQILLLNMMGIRQGPVIIPTGIPGTSGFRAPFAIKQELFNFLQHANLGPVDPRNPAAGLLRDHISLIGTSSTYMVTQSLITKLFAIYARVNNLTALSKHNRGKPESEWNHQWLGADQPMKTYLVKTLSFVQNLSLRPLRVKQRAAKKAPLQMKLENAQNMPERKRTRLIRQIANVKPFDPEDFRYFEFQTMIMFNRYGPTDPLPPNINTITKDFLNFRIAIRKDMGVGNIQVGHILQIYSVLTNNLLASIKFGDNVKLWGALMVKIYGIDVTTGESKAPTAVKMFFRLNGEAKLAEEILKTYQKMQKERERAANPPMTLDQVTALLRTHFNVPQTTPVTWTTVGFGAPVPQPQPPTPTDDEILAHLHNMGIN